MSRESAARAASSYRARVSFWQTQRGAAAPRRTPGGYSHAMETFHGTDGRAGTGAAGRSHPRADRCARPRTNARRRRSASPRTGPRGLCRADDAEAGGFAGRPQATARADRRTAPRPEAGRRQRAVDSRLLGLGRSSERFPVDQRFLAGRAAGPPLGARHLAEGRGRLAVGRRLMGVGPERAAGVRPAAAGVAGARPDCAGSRK